MDAALGNDQKKYHFLFMLSAKQATVKKESDRDYLILNEVDEKLLFMSARPGRTCAFMSAIKFLNNWKTNNKVFLEHKPRVAIIDSDMEVDKNGIAEAIEITLANPTRDEKNNWKFDLTFLSINTSTGIHHNITLMIDWPANKPCPPPIKIHVPSLILE